MRFENGCGLTLAMKQDDSPTLKKLAIPYSDNYPSARGRVSSPDMSHYPKKKAGGIPPAGTICRIRAATDGGGSAELGRLQPELHPAPVQSPGGLAGPHQGGGVAQKSVVP
ncbi:MAG: hypothetical protein D6791_13590 [Chloroflexi bacterium]|nr:MAG: hypothetical protein D6791_13590 [Chloroflexota bacterium]